MKEFKNNKNKDIVPRILGGLTVPSGVLIIFLSVVSIPFMFIPSFKFYKLPILIVFILGIYSVLSYIDVSNNGIQHVFKKTFAKKITAIKIKHTPKHHKE